MAEQASSTAIVPAAPLEGEYCLEVKEYTPSGASSKFIVKVPETLDANNVSVMLRAAILKRTTWSKFEFPVILHAVVYADRMGLDIMAGDVYQAEEGRLSTTAGAKIRHAMASNKIEGYDVKITEGPVQEFKYSTQKDGAQSIRLPNYKAVVTVHVRGFKTPVIYETTLAEWFTGRNPNWRQRPTYMLRKNALSKAFEEVAPMGVDVDEAPPLTEPNTAALTAFDAAKAKVEGDEK